MTKQTLIMLLQIGGLTHIGLACAGALLPKVVRLRAHLQTLPPLIGQLFWVYYSFIATCLVGFGFFTFLMAEQLATGTPLTQALLVWFIIFWSIRLFAAAFVFNVEQYLTNRWLRFGYWCTNVVFVYLVTVYALALWNSFQGAPTL